MAPRLFRAARKLTGRRRFDRRAARQRMFQAECRRIADTVTAPVVVKVGAHDGLSGDLSAEVTNNDPRWRGLMIEPVPDLFARLTANLGDKPGYALENVAVGQRAGGQTFYTVDPRAAQDPAVPHYYDQLGSFDRNHLLKHANGVLEPYIREIHVEVQPLTHLIERNALARVDVLQIDAEGFDYQVIQTLDFSRYRPTLILIEQRHLSPSEHIALLDLFRDLDYEVYDCGADYLGIASS